MSNARLVLSALALALGVAGCAGRSSAPDPAAQKPIDMPVRWAGPAPEGAASATSARWWTAFGDARLDALIDAARVDNTDIGLARIQVVRARLQSELGNPALTATLDVQTQVERHSASQGMPGAQMRTSSLDAGLNYEVDLWGRLAALRSGDEWRLAASESDRDAAQLVVVGLVADSYWLIGLLNDRLAQNDGDVADAERTFALVRARYGAGAVSGLDLAQAEAGLVSRRRERASFLQQRLEARNALAILLDRAPEASVPEPEGLPENALPVIDAGLPASLLSARPDVRAAEQRLRAASAGVDATRTSLYPALRLTGSLGTSSLELGEFLRNPVGKVAADLVLPMLDWHGTRLKLAEAQASHDDAALRFRQVLYRALSEVENALAVRQKLEGERGKLQRILALNRRAERLTEVRYRAGAVALQALLDAQRARRAAQVELTQNRMDQLGAAMKLYQALGGAA